MTCVIGSRQGWMVADRRMTESGVIIPLLGSKIQKFNGRTLVGCAGDSVARTKIRDLDLIEGQIHDSLIMDAIRGLDCHCLIVRDGRVSLCMGNGYLDELPCEYWAIGSGADHAYGFLKGIEKGHRDSDNSLLHLEPEDAVAAIQFASGMIPGVSAETNVEVL